MTDQAAQHEQPENQAAKKCTRKGFCWFVILALLVLCAVIAVAFIQLRESSSLAGESAKQIAALQAAMTDLQSSVKNTNDLSAKTKQEMDIWQANQQGHLTQWHLAEARYLVRMASEQLQLAQNQAIAKAALKEADAILIELNDPQLMAIRQSIAGDLAALEASPAVDVTQIYLKLNAINANIDHLPLPATPLTPNETTAKPAAPAASWDAKWQNVKDSLQKIVVVRQLQNGAEPLVMPEQKQFLMQNLHAQLEQAMWAALNRNDDVYQASLGRASTWIHTYFVITDPATQSVLDQIKTLQGLKLAVASQTLTETLQQFERYQTHPSPSEPVATVS